MRRTNIYLPEAQLDLLRQVSERRGKPVAELVRDAVDTWLSAQGVKRIDKDEWEARFDALLRRRGDVAQRRRFSEGAVARDVTAAVRDVRRRRTASRH